MFSGIFDQLLSAMNDEEEEEGVAVAGPSSGMPSRWSPMIMTHLTDLDLILQMVRGILDLVSQAPCSARDCHQEVGGRGLGLMAQAR